MFDLSWPIIFNILVGITVVFVGLGTFSNLSWISKFRVTGVFVAGILLLGVFCWPMVKPDNPFEPVLLVNGAVGVGSVVAILAVAFLAGAVGFFVSWPKGREMGIAAVPAGLCVWAFRSASVGDMMVTCGSVEEKYAIFQKMQWEGLFWLAVFGAGYAGVFAAEKIKAKKEKLEENAKKPDLLNIFLQGAASVVISLFIGTFCIWILAQDVKLADSKLGFVIGQPHVLQICFAVLLGFTAAGFVVKKFLNSSYIWPLISTCLVSILVTSIYVHKETMVYMAENWPGNFFNNSILSILPVQMIAFGALGAISGYWLSVRLDYWKKHQC